MIRNMDDMHFFMREENNAGILKELKKMTGQVTPFLFSELLFYSIQKKCDEIFDALCEMYILGQVFVDIDKDFPSGQNALSLAVIQNNFNYFQKLLLLGASIDKAVGLNLSKTKKITTFRDSHEVTPLSLMVDLARIDMLKHIKHDVDKKLFVKEAIRIIDKKDKKDIFSFLTEGISLAVKEMLTSAIKENKADLVEALLKLKNIKTIDYVNENGETPLILAVKNKAYDVVDVFKTFLEKKKINFDVDFSVNGTNPLNEALMLNDEKMIKLILFMGASPMAGVGVFQIGKNQKKEEVTPLMNEIYSIMENKDKSDKNLFYLTRVYSQVELIAVAVQMAQFFGSKNIYRKLLKDKEDLSREDIFTQKLIDCVKKEDIDMINFLIKKNVSPVAVMGEKTAIHEAAKEGKVSILNIFLRDLPLKKIDTLLKNVTPFEMAVWHNQEAAAIVLLKAGANVLKKFASGDLLISRMIDFDMGELLKLSVQKNPNLKSDLLFKKALWQSVGLGRNKCVDALLDMNVDVDFKNRFNLPLLLYAVKKKNYYAMFKLIKKGADVFAVDSDGMSALHFAIQNKDEKIASWLIDNGSDLNLQNRFGQTPLMLAVERGLKTVVVHLIQNRANINITDQKGKKAIDYYKVYKNKNQKEKV